LLSDKAATVSDSHRYIGTHQIQKFVCFYETLTNSKICTESRIEISVWLSFSAIGRLSPVITSHRTEENPPKYTCHERGFYNNFQHSSQVSEQDLQYQAAFCLPQQAL
jgi:hypothetical protein